MIYSDNPSDTLCIRYAYPIDTHSMYRDRDLYRDGDGDGDKTKKNTKTEKKTFYANLQKSASSSQPYRFARDVKSSRSRFHNRREAA